MDQLGPGEPLKTPGLKGADSHRCYKLRCSADPETEEQVEALIESKLPKKRGGKEKAHRIYNTEYGSKSLVPMDSFVAKDLFSMSKGEVLKIQALADSGSSASIISLDLARQLGLDAEDPGSAKLEDALGTRMDVTALANVAVR